MRRPSTAVQVAGRIGRAPPFPALIKNALVAIKDTGALADTMRKRKGFPVQPASSSIITMANRNGIAYRVLQVSHRVVEKVIARNAVQAPTLFVVVFAPPVKSANIMIYKAQAHARTVRAGSISINLAVARKLCARIVKVASTVMLRVHPCAKTATRVNIRASLGRILPLSAQPVDKDGIQRKKVQLRRECVSLVPKVSIATNLALLPLRHALLAKRVSILSPLVRTQLPYACLAQ